MAGTYVQSWNTDTAAVSSSFSLTISGATANNLLVATVATRSNVSGMTLAASAGWTVAVNNIGSRTSNCILYRVASGTSADNLTVTLTGGTTRLQLLVKEIAGLDSVAPFDGYAQDSTNISSPILASGTPKNTGSVTPTSANGTAVFSLSVYDRRAWAAVNPGDDITTSGTVYGKSGFGVAHSRPFAMLAMRNYTSAVAQTETFSQGGDATNEYVGATVTVFKEAGGGAVHSTLDIDAGSYALTGANVDLTYAPAAVHSTLDISAGSYSVTGNTVGLTASRALSIAAGSYSLSGRTIELNQASGPQHQTLTINAGSYSLTGNDINLAAGRAVSIAAGSYATTGNAIGVAAGRVLNIDLGTYSTQGNSLRLNYSAGDPDVYMHLKVGGVWVQALPYINVGGTWVQAVPYTKSGGVWKSG